MQRKGQKVENKKYNKKLLELDVYALTPEDRYERAKRYELMLIDAKLLVIAR